MEPKYRNGQRVKIKEAKNQHGHLKYPKLQEHINETGIIVETYVAPIYNLPGQELVIDNYPIYKVRLDKGIILEVVPEDALVGLDE